MRPHSKRRPHPQPSALQVLIEAAAPVLAAHGEQRSPAPPWIAAAEVSIKIAQGCGWSLQDTPESYLGPMLAYRGWTWRLEGADLILTLPGWVEPPMRLVAVQPGLFGYAVG